MSISVPGSEDFTVTQTEISSTSYKFSAPAGYTSYV